MDYLYKIKHKYTKNYYEMNKYGFLPYTSEDGEQLYAKLITMPPHSPIYNYLKRTLEKVYLKATTEERERDFKDLQFKEILTPEQQRDYELIMTPELEKEFTECMLCVSVNGFGKGCLFLNGPDSIDYFNTRVLDSCCGEIIDLLTDEGVIYKKRIPLSMKKQS